MPALGAAGPVKFSPLMFGPPLAVLVLHRSPHRGRTVLELVLGGIAVAVAVVLVVAVAMLALRPSWVSGVQAALLATGAAVAGLLDDLGAIGAEHRAS